MEKFMYLFRNNPGQMASASPEQRQAQLQKWYEWMQALSQKGMFVSGEPLQGTGALVSGSEKVVTDGPYIETKELVSGFVIVHANDLTHAIEMSKECPIFNVNGSLEVRPVQKMESM